MSRLLVLDTAHAAWLAGQAGRFERALLLAAVAVSTLLALSLLVPNVWLRMALFYLLLVPLALGTQPLRWRALLVPTPRAVGIGVTAALALYLLGWLVVRLLLALQPALATQIADLYAWRDLVGAPLVWALLAMIVVGEEIVWRGAITLPLAARLGPWRGATLGALAFGAGHLAFGIPLLTLVAVLAGGFWALVAIRTRGLLPALVCHLLWDGAVLFVFPY